MTAERYLAIVGTATQNARNLAIRERMARLGMERHEFGDGLVLFRTAGVAVTRSEHCAIIGGIHDRASPSLVERPGPEDLVRACWGDYIAFGLASGESQVNWILRAPLGHLPALRASAGETTLLASHAEDLLYAMDAEPQIDWTFVAEHLACQHLQTAKTGLLAIDELVGGGCLRRGPDQDWVRTTLWTPWTFTAAEREIRTPADAERALRDSVNQAVAGLTQSGGPYLLELSGGLDSSILAAALATAKAPARAITFVTQSAEGDERAYAHAAARSAGLPLTELAIGPEIEFARQAFVRTARPGLPMLLAPADRILADNARDDGTAMFISGAGGDCVLCSPASAAPAADAIRRFGIGKPSWHAIDDLARIHNANVWTVARMAWRQALSGPRHARWPITSGLLNAQQVPLSPPAHPWLDEPSDILPGKRSHVRAILAALAHVDGYGRHTVAPSRFPLLSQPVVETALRIPTWLWIAQGRDRSVARQAWRNVLPAQILDRRTKGGLDGYAIEALAANRAKLAPFLLEGHLANAGVIDRTRVEAALYQTARRGDVAPYLLLPLIDTEAWARAWLGEP